MVADLCVVGHVTLDIIQVNDKEWTQPGGVAHYGATAARMLGAANVVVITTLAREHESLLLSDLRRAGVQVHVRWSPRTTQFVNRHSGGSGERIQELRAEADPITSSDLSEDGSRVWYFGPLTPTDISVECVAAARQRGGRIALDAQGLLRQTRDERISLVRRPKRIAEYLKHVDILKVTEAEATTAAGSEDLAQAARDLYRMGPREVVVTRGRKGSVVHDGSRIAVVPVYPVDHAVDTTGCGDTYFAAYLLWRLRGHDPHAAGRFASAAAALKSTRKGCLRAPAEEVQRFALNTRTQVRPEG